MKVEELKENCEMTDALLDRRKLREKNVESNQMIMPSGQDVRGYRKILVVDDDEFIRRTLSNVLNYMGFNVTEANNGVEGLDIFQKTIFDLVITDFMMPCMDGCTMAFYIKKDSPFTPVIMVTGQEEEAVMKNINKSYLDVVLFKPFSVIKLGERIQGILCPILH